MKKKWFALPLSALALIVGCASGPDPVPNKTATGSQAVAQIDSNLTRLRDLQVFAVGSLVQRIPEGTGNCYGLPCNEEEAVKFEALKVVQAERLAELTELATLAVGNPAPASACEPAAIDANLERLSGLAIVTVEGLMKVEPEAQPNCYNLPCPEDIERAEATNCERAKDLAAIVEAASGLTK